VVATPILEVEGLVTHYFTSQGPVEAVSGVSFAVDESQTLGLAGESGCGKTTAALSIMGLLPSNGRIMDGKIILDGEDLLKKDEAAMRKIRWKKVSIVFQGAMNALNPVINVGEQIAEVIIEKEKASKEKAWERVRELFKLVEIEPSRAQGFPHEFSGGMRQRVMIAMALACKPRLVIADEPTTALDVMIQAQIISLLKNLQKDLDLAMIVISHDLSVLAETCEQLSIMYAGKLVERSTSVAVFEDPHHPYTKGLIAAFPNIHGKKIMPASIAGNPPNLIKAPVGCRFAERCFMAKEICLKEEPSLVEVKPGHWAACHFVPSMKG
jgi:oligopeptide/dipeptide ABC transporter ATP-binding protein